jgi:hypothetical protein
MFGNDRTQMRRMFTDSWTKMQQGMTLEPLEQLVAEIVRQHPEYHAMLEKPDSALQRDFLPEGGETNPFLHMAMHISIKEQLSTERPAGIGDLYRQLVGRKGDPHEVEHLLMECLGEMLWEAQRNGTLPDEITYLECVRRLAG